ncbi:hypothetical protein LTR85_004595 [Meristemomyces frigidus]|nr:hypothetical protein LTR85_004595 [Meristemomyces frigidus]
MGTKSIKVATKALQAHFSAAKIPLSLPAESRRMLQNFVDDHDEGVSEEESASANAELKNFWERYVGENPAKTGLFVGVLRELRPAIVRQADILEWWELVVKPVITGTGYKKQAQDDAQAFLVGCMVHDEDEDSDYEDDHEGARTCERLLGELLAIYISRTRTLTEEDELIAPENAKVAQHVEDVLIAFGRKQPEDFFLRIDDLIAGASTRLQTLTLLSSFLRHQTPHLYLVANTHLIKDLLKCLMNDTSTTVLSVALTSLIMLLPHIPGSLGEHLPRLFLVYSRLLCWEKFSPLSTAEQKNLVTDDRVSTGPEADHGDVGIDPTWEKARPSEALTEAATPEVMTYFTYLYCLYPLNFMSYVRKPRRYLKNHDFPGAEDFDLDQVVIRKRTDQFSAVHLCHPNFYSLTVEEELIDPKWPKADPADVVADCHSLCVNAKLALVSPGPPPTGKLPEVPPMPPWANMSRSGQVSPSTSYASFRSGNSWRDTQSTAVSGQIADGDSPVLRPHDIQQHDSSALRPRSKASNTNRTSPNLDDFPQPGGIAARSPKKEGEEAPQTNLAFLQQENVVLRNDLNLEKGKVAQYTWHISQLQRKNVKDTTAEAETLNLINANRLLKLQLDQVRNAREATLKDSALTRKQANGLESNLTEKFNAFKKEQETWRADAEELRRLRKETGQYRALIGQTEERELKKTHQLELVKRDLEEMEKIQRQLQDAQHRLREYEYREFEMDRAVRENEILQHEKETLQMRVQRHQQDHERSRRVYGDKVAELEAQLEANDSAMRQPHPGRQPSQGDIQILVQHAIADSQGKLAQMKKMHNALMQKYADLELEYETVKEQLDAIQGPRTGQSNQSFLRDSDGDGLTPRAYEGNGSHLDTMSGGLGHHDGAFDSGSDTAYVTSTSDPSSRRYQPAIRGMPISPPSSSEATMHSAAGLTWRPPPVSRQDSLASKSSGVPATTFNQTAPLSNDEMLRGSGKSAFSVGSADSQRKKEKIKPDSQVRVYGRGGAQNIKLKTKDKDASEEPKKSKGGLRGVFR